MGAVSHLQQPVPTTTGSLLRRHVDEGLAFPPVELGAWPSPQWATHIQVSVSDGVGEYSCVRNPRPGTGSVTTIREIRVTERGGRLTLTSAPTSIHLLTSEEANDHDLHLDAAQLLLAWLYGREEDRASISLPEGLEEDLRALPRTHLVALADALSQSAIALEAEDPDFETDPRSVNTRLKAENASLQGQLTHCQGRLRRSEGIRTSLENALRPPVRSGSS